MNSLIPFLFMIAQKLIHKQEMQGYAHCASGTLKATCFHFHAVICTTPMPFSSHFELRRRI